MNKIIIIIKSTEYKRDKHTKANTRAQTL